MEKTLKMESYKECKGSVRYKTKDADESEYISDVYVKKTHLPKPYPQSIMITIKC